MAGHHVVVAVFRRDAQVLLGHRHPARAWYPDCWDLIGGHLEPGESALEALVRECREELGVEISGASPVPVPVSEPDVTMSAYLVERWQGEIANGAPDEHDAIGWFGRADLPSLRLADTAYLPWLTALLG